MIDNVYNQILEYDVINWQLITTSQIESAKIIINQNGSCYRFCKCDNCPLKSIFRNNEYWCTAYRDNLGYGRDYESKLRKENAERFLNFARLRNIK